MSSELPLPTLLSHVLVAYTIEFDNEFEHQMPHRTSRGAPPSQPHAPWLVSLAMWTSCLQLVGEEGVTVGELERLARTGTNLNGMQRWGYIVVKPDPTDERPKPPESDWVIRATRAGRKAQEVWRPLFGAIEQRWCDRFGSDEIDRLRGSLWAVVGQLDRDLPDFLPILGYGLYTRGRHPGEDRFAGSHIDRERQEQDAGGSDLTLPTLISRPLLAFAIEFERESDLSLAISANVLRVLDETGVRVRDLPLLAGVSKEAISMAMGILQKKHLVLVEQDQAGSAWKIARLTPQGRAAQEAYRHLLGAIEERWRTRFGEDAIGALRTLLERLVGESDAQRSPLFQGLEPYPDGWRASVRRPNTLPHYPMVLHRGGFPDGA